MKSKKKLSRKYVPFSLSASDKTKQIKSILNKTVRPKLNSFKNKKSRHIIKFENKYGIHITDHKYISKHIISKAGIDKILNKGMGAYYSSGSRPNQTPHSWANARLASVILFGPAFNVDKNIAMKYGKKQWLDSKH